MATIKIGAAAPDSFSGFLFDDIDRMVRTSTRLTLYNDTATDVSQTLVLEGSGFRYTSGQAYDGTITEVRAYDSEGRLLITYSDLSVDLPRFLVTLTVAGSYDATGFLINGNDRLYGSTGNDDLDGGAGNDYIAAGRGDDFVADFTGRDTLDGGAGFDEISFANDLYDGWHRVGGVVLDALTGAATDPWGYSNVIRNFESFTGSYQKDVLKGSNTSTYTEVFRGLLGNDTIDGRGGLDRVEYDRDAYYGGKLAVTVNLAKGIARDGFGNTDRLYNIEQAGGSTYNDKLIGNAAANQLYGHNGNDTLDGGAGNDVLTGGKGIDNLTGGAGKDTFAFNYSTEGWDRIRDFSNTDDTISVSSSGFGGVLSTGTISRNQLVRNEDPHATLAHGQFLYDTDSGVLSWDVDGTGSTAAVRIAVLSGAASIFYSDITVY
ncbi:calcium-binding protein [Segnochrobactraceae bacterium EtOH-i3]